MSASCIRFRSHSGLGGVSAEGGFWGWWSGLGVGVLGSEVSGRSQCRVVAFSVSGLRESDFLFITISHCAWRHVISLSKATKKRSKENAFKTRAHKCPQRAVFVLLVPQKHGARQSHGWLNPSFSRILTRTRFAPNALGQAPMPTNAYGFTRLCCFSSCWVGGVV